MNSKFLLGSLLAVSVGWWLGQVPVSDPGATLDQQLAERMQSSPQFVEDCLSNAEHEFTPGFRAHRLLAEQRGQFSEAQGRLLETRDGRDIALIGPGFLVVQDPHKAGHYYTRDGRLSFRDGKLFTQSGLAVLGTLAGSDLVQELAVPASLACRNLEITQHGLCRLQKDDGSLLEFQLAIVTFGQPGCLVAVDSRPSTFSESSSSGRAQAVVAENLQIAQGWLEVSNADDQEMVHVVRALHSYCGLSSEPVSANWSPPKFSPPAVSNSPMIGVQMTTPIQLGLPSFNATLPDQPLARLGMKGIGLATPAKCANGGNHR